MSERTDQPRFAAIVVAAGSGNRAKQSLPKQFVQWRGKPLVRHSVEALLAAKAEPVVVAIAPDAEDLARAALDGLDLQLVAGGATRQASVRAALESLADPGAEQVLIHDAARPVLPFEVITRLISALAESPGAIPVLPVVDSLVVETDSMMERALQRDTARRVQTPQAFRMADILSAHRAWQGEPNAGDDAQVLAAAGGKIALVEGDERMAKLTVPDDFESRPLAVRTGTGYDVHRLVEGEELWLCGVLIEHTHGLSGHSDADVGIHALVDALLGAIAEGDIGRHFPPSDPKWKGARSAQFLEHAASLVEAAGYFVGNVDVTLICEAPKIGPHVSTMREMLAKCLQIDMGQVSVKATTTERLGPMGRREGIAAQACATVLRSEP